MDGEYNEPLPFANVLIKGTQKGSTTDIDGKFRIKTEPGTYTLVFSFIGYTTVEISDVVVKGKEDTFIQVTLNPESNQLEGVVIKTTSKRNTEASVLVLQKKSINLVDGLSIQAIRKSGDSDIAGAIKRVPGISVQGGKYVYVRGLGDRYSKTTLNGMELPGLDPDRNTIPMDIFPTNLIDNLIVKKSASSDIGADFTGGTVDIKLKDFSFDPQYSVRFSAGFNPDMHFNSNFIADKKSNTDWLGRDSGYRSLPIDPSLDLPGANPNPITSPENAAILTENTRKLTKTMKPIQQTSDMNYSFGLSASQGFNFKEDGDATIGYIAALGYKSQTQFFENFYRSTVFRTPRATIEQDFVQDAQRGVINKYVSALLGLSYKDNRNKISVNYINLQNGESNAIDLTRQAFIENPYYGEGSVLTYTQRNLTSIPIIGTHTLGENNAKISWKLGRSKSTLNDKDFKRAIFETDADRSIFLISPNVIASPNRLWRDLEETGDVGKLDFEIPLKKGDFSGKFIAGASYIKKERDFNSKNFDIFYNGTSTVLEGNPNNILADENIWVQSPNLFQAADGSFIAGGFERTNIFNSESLNYAFYYSAELKFNDWFRAVLGVRLETYELRYTGEDLQGTTYDGELFIEDENAFANVNFIFSPNEKSNIRASFYQTTARPTFKEASTAYLVDPVTETIFLGNPNIQSSFIDNFDLRYEFFGEKGQMFSISAFLKKFENPIEIAVVSQNTPQDFTAKNNETATVQGVEIELRKKLFSYNEINFSLNANGSYIDAKQRMNDVEYEDRVRLAEPGQVIDRNRELQGQSPYMVNVGITANQSEKELQAGIYYNLQGPTLQVVGIGGVPDVFTVPFHNLDFSAFKVFKGDDVRKKITFRVRNILDQKRESIFIWNNEDVGTFQSLSPGITFSLGVSLTF